MKVGTKNVVLKKELFKKGLDSMDFHRILEIKTSHQPSFDTYI